MTINRLRTVVHRCVVALALAQLLAVPASHAAPELPDGSGKAIVQNVCQKCHELAIVVAANRNEAEWTKVVDDMVTKGAMLEDSEFDAVVNYLTKYYGSAGPSPASVGGAAARDPGGLNDDVHVLVSGPFGATKQLSFLAPRSGDVLAQLTLTDAVQGVAMSSDGELAFVAGYGGSAYRNSISVIEVKTHRELRRVDLGAGSRPSGIVYSGGRVYFAAEGSKLVGRLDPGSGRVDFVLGVGQQGTRNLAVSKAGSLIATANSGSDTVSLLELGATGEWTASHVKVAKAPEGIDITSDGREIWVAHRQSESISVIDVASRRVKGTVNSGVQSASRLLFGAQGSLAIVCSDAGELAVLDIASRSIKKRIQLGRQVSAVSLSQDGMLVFVSAFEGKATPLAASSIEILDLQSLELRTARLAQRGDRR